MRESRNERRAKTGQTQPGSGGVRCVTYDGKSYFESFYRAGARDEAMPDRVTLGMVTEPESRFHYNGVENSIIRAHVRMYPPPPGVMASAWHEIQKRSGMRLLDVGSGTGHWIDFFISTFLVSHATGIEITDKMCAFLRGKYSGRPAVRIVNADVSSPSFFVQDLGGPFEYISAIGVLFHIVDDDKWRSAIANLSAALSPEGLMFVGDEFGVETRSVQFHNSDHFDTWREHDQATGREGELRVNKRVRSLADWQRAAGDAGLVLVDLVRTDRDPAITTPEADILVLRRQP
jgi:SAM-dependent methyltransferase